MVAANKLGAWREWSTRRRAAVVAVIGVVAVLIAWFAAFGLRVHNRGLDTTCGDFLRMNHSQRVAVMNKAHIYGPGLEERITYYVTGCRQDVRDRDYPIDDIQG